LEIRFAAPETKYKKVDHYDPLFFSHIILYDNEMRAKYPKLTRRSELLFCFGLLLSYSNFVVSNTTSAQKSLNVAKCTSAAASKPPTTDKLQQILLSFVEI